MAPVHIHHISLNCQDPIAVERFYTRHFGFQRVRVVPMGERQIVFLSGAGIRLELFPATEDRPFPRPEKDGYLWPSVRNISFEVDNLDAKIAAMGKDADVTLGPLSFDDIVPGWRSVWLRDPAGNIVQLTQGYTDQDNPTPLPPA